MSTKTTKKEIVLQLLLQAYPGFVTSRQLVEARAGWRYSASVHRLKKDGYDIASDRVDPSEPGLWKFWLRHREPVGHLSAGQQAELPL